MAEQVEQFDLDAVVADLQTWTEMTGKPLPFSAEFIAGVEAAGGVVDLLDGSITVETEMQHRRAVAVMRGAAVFVALLLALLVQHGTARAERPCPRGVRTPQGCVYQVDANTVCVWNGAAPLCIRLGVQQ